MFCVIINMFYKLIINYAIFVLICSRLAIFISGNESVYPGETANFTCHVDTVGIDLVTFQWVRIDGDDFTYFNETVDMEISGGDSSTMEGPDYFFNSTFNVVNVNYTDNDAGYYCNASGCNVSITAYLTGNGASEYVSYALLKFRISL